MSDAPFDARSVANLLLDEADRIGIRVSNLVLQKLLYFAHGIFLIATKRPLVSGYFEAWEYGPVHPAVYNAFRESGSGPISSRAKGQNILTGESRSIPNPANPAVRRVVQQVLNSYGNVSPGRLVDIAHAKNAPWEFIVDKSRTAVTFGLQIPDSVIVERFKYHKVSVGDAPLAGEPSEDTPLT